MDSERNTKEAEEIHERLIEGDIPRSSPDHRSLKVDERAFIAQAFDDAEARVRREYEPLAAWAERACRELEIHWDNLGLNPKCDSCADIADEGRDLLRGIEEVGDD